MFKAAARAAFQVVDDGWRLRNHRRARVLVYTDSRGLNMTSRSPRLPKHYYGSHVDWLQRHYRVDHLVCPHSHTTIVDFLTYMDRRSGHCRYDAIVLHCGVVDFSPRPVSSIEIIKAAKAGQPRFDDLFRFNASYHAAPSEQTYEGERTTTLYSPEFQRSVVDELRSVENLVWISSNSFVPGWDGNWRPRPANIDETISSFDAAMHARLANTIDLREWSHAEIQKFTIDNIHFTKAGFADVASRTAAALRPFTE